MQPAPQDERPNTPATTPSTSTDANQTVVKLTAAEERRKERKRRQREIGIAAIAFVVVLILTTFQLDQFRSGDALFVAMFNFNFVLLFGILLVVIRNSIKLLLERRRRVLGSHLRTKLVLAFVGLSLLPCLLMFLVTTKYVQLSMDFWFKDQIETSMETALDVARGIYEKTGSRLVSQSQSSIDEVRKRRFIWTGPAMDSLMSKKRTEYQLALFGLYTFERNERTWHATETATETWHKIKKDLDWSAIQRHGYMYTLIEGENSDFLFAIVAVDAGRSGYFIAAEDMGKNFKSRLDRVARGAGEYKNLRKIKQPLKLMLYSSLGVLTGLIILGAIWFGFRVAREISAPVLALAAGTEAITKGDLSIRLSDNSSDELGMLIRSFNRMAHDLEESQREITGANRMLEEQNLRMARHTKYIETVLNNIAAGVVSFEYDGTINTLNKAACEILDLPAENLLGKKVEDIFPEQHGTVAKNIRERFSQRLDHKASHTTTLFIRGEERRLHVNVVGFSTDGVYRGAVAVFEDISELERMQRMAAWREVARRIAHEIKNPLTPIKLSAQRLAKKFGSQVSDPVFNQSTELIVKQVESLQDMVQEFSAFAKLPEVNPVPGNLPPLLESLTELFRNSHTGIHWELRVTESIPVLPMDKEALHRAFLNIYTNAAEVLEQHLVHNPFVCITVSSHPELRHIRIDVADNGPGLTDEERSRLFEPYFSHKKGGTGLGLTIVRSIISDHHGYVRAFPRDGGGTVISIELPVS